MTNSLDIADFPAILTAMAYRPSPTTIARWVIQPEHVMDTRLKPGEVYQMDRYGYLPDQGDMDIESRTRSENEIVGTQNTRQIPSTKIPILLRELTGPGSGDPSLPGLPGNFRFSIPSMVRQQRTLWDLGYAEPLIQPQFHSSVGSDTLLMDYRQTIDRCYIRAAQNTPNKLNPSNIADGGTYAAGPPRFTVDDLDFVLEWLVTGRAPAFGDGTYRGLLHPKFLNHLRRDPRFREQVQAASYFPVALIMNGQDNFFGPGYMPPAIPQESANVNGVNISLLRQYQEQFRSPIEQPSLLGFMPYIGQSLPGLDNLAMPGGLIYDQFRLFISNNIPTRQVQLTYTAVTAPSTEPTGSALRTAYPGIFFSQQAVGELYGGDPQSEIPVQIKRNQNDDYNRFLIVIWQAFLGLARLNDDFAIEARTYGL